MADLDTSITATATTPPVVETPAPTVHAALANQSDSVLDYINTELAKHKELLTIVDALKSNVDTVHAELNEAGKKILQQQKLPIHHKAIVAVCGAIVIALIASSFFI